MQFLDAHTHVIAPDRSAYPLRPLGGKQSGWSSTRSLTGRQLLDAMDQAGVDRAMVVQASTAYGFDNSYVADTLDDVGRERFGGVCSVDFRSPTVTTDLDYWINERHLAGVRLFSTGSTMPEQADWIAGEETFAAWSWLESNEIPVCLQMRPTGVALLGQILDRFPGLTIVLDHAAQPVLTSGPPYPESAGIFSLAAFDNVHIKVTNDNFERAEQFPAGAAGIVAALVEHFGADRIMWGTNFPATDGTLTDLVAAARSALDGLSEPEREAVFHDTAARVYAGVSA